MLMVTVFPEDFEPPRVGEVCHLEGDEEGEASEAYCVLRLQAPNMQISIHVGEEDLTAAQKLACALALACERVEEAALSRYSPA